MGIDADIDIVADQVADIVDQFDVARGFEIAHGKLDDAEALVLHERLHVLRIRVEGHLVLAVDVGKPAPGVGRHGDLRDHGRIEVEDVTQVLMKGLVGDLAGEIPVGHAQQAPYFRVEGVLSHDLFAEFIALAGDALGHADQALVGLELGEGEALRGSVPPLGAPPGHQYPPGAHVRDLQTGSPAAFVDMALPGLDIRHIFAVEDGDGVDVIHDGSPSRMDSTRRWRLRHT